LLEFSALPWSFYSKGFWWAALEMTGIRIRSGAPSLRFLQGVGIFGEDFKPTLFFFATSEI
jgi:hypothetical protein